MCEWFLSNHALDWALRKTSEYLLFLLNTSLLIVFLYVVFFRVCWIYHVTGVWVYPLLDYLGTTAKIVFFATVTVLINIFYLLGEVLNNCIWDTQKCEYQIEKLFWIQNYTLVTFIIYHAFTITVEIFLQSNSIIS